MKRYAEVIIDRVSKELDKLFFYGVPDNLENDVAIGSRVSVPFGNGRRAQAFVVGFTGELGFDESKLKFIYSVLDKKPIFSGHMIELARWMKEKYYCTFAECLRCIMPAGIGMKSEYIISTIGAPNLGTKTKAYSIFEYIKNNNNLATLSDLEQEFGAVTAALNLLLKNKSIEKTEISKVKNYVIYIKYVSPNEAMQGEIDLMIDKGGLYANILSYLVENRRASISDLKDFFGISVSPINT
ncbi:MAG: hypothetical protein LBV08_03590, partial [Clostridiales bacterium]|nr:hypothetical protein [Clostridiales bacterium]